MSKLSELIRRTARREQTPFGFHPSAARVQSASMLLVVALRGSDTAAVERVAGAGADSILLAPDGRLQPESLASATAAGSPAAVGLWLQEVDLATAESSRGSGVDFLVFDDEHTPAELLLNEALGLVLSLPEDAADTQLRAIATLPVDALLVSHWEGALTIRRQLELRRLSGLSQKPLMLTVKPDLEGAALESLREAGVVAIIVDGENTDAPAIMRVRETIAKLPPRRRRRDERPDAIIPGPGAGHDHEGEEGDED